jgi:coenzyme F420-reducing hydrogenase delta subunit
MGIEPERVKLVWASAAEGVKLTQEINKMVEEVRALGPLNWSSGNGNVKVSAEIRTAEEVTP